MANVIISYLPAFTLRLSTQVRIPSAFIVSENLVSGYVGLVPPLTRYYFLCQIRLILVFLLSIIVQGTFSLFLGSILLDAFVLFKFIIVLPLFFKHHKSSSLRRHELDLTAIALI
jgi:hypothetical protein